MVAIIFSVILIILVLIGLADIFFDPFRADEDKWIDKFWTRFSFGWLLIPFSLFALFCIWIPKAPAVVTYCPEHTTKVLIVNQGYKCLAGEPLIIEEKK